MLVLALAAAGAAALAWRELNTPLRVGRGGRVAAHRERDAVCAASRPISRSEACSTSRGCSRPTHDSRVTLRAFARASISSREGTTPLTLLAKLVSGDVYLHQITIVEGSRFAELLAALRAHPAVEATDSTAPRS